MSQVRNNADRLLLSSQDEEYLYNMTCSKTAIFFLNLRGFCLRYVRYDKINKECNIVLLFSRVTLLLYSQPFVFWQQGKGENWAWAECIVNVNVRTFNEIIQILKIMILIKA